MNKKLITFSMMAALSFSSVSAFAIGNCSSTDGSIPTAKEMAALPVLSPAPTMGSDSLDGCPTTLGMKYQDGSGFMISHLMQTTSASSTTFVSNACVYLSQVGGVVTVCMKN
jgi:hypothetical protein